MNLNIITYPNDLLRKKSSDVKLPLSKEDSDLLKEMYTFMKNPENNAAGLSAVQIGILKRMCVVQSKAYGSFKLVNPRIIWHSTNKEMNTEGCLSVKPDIDCLVPRWSKIRVIAFDALQNKNINMFFEGYMARVIQHELDHMDGILYIDYNNSTGDKEV